MRHLSLLSVFLLFAALGLRAQTLPPPTGGNAGDFAVQPEVINLNEVTRSIGYPEAARTAGAQGKVIVKVLVNSEGKYEKHEVVKDPDQRLTQAVEKALPRLRFKPARTETGPTDAWIVIPFQFKLD